MSQLLSRISVAVAATFMPLKVLADVENGFGHGHMYGGFDSAWMMLGPVLWLAVIGLIVWLLVTRMQWSGMSGQSGNKARDALDLRFANGEIDASEYAERRKLLS